MSSDRVEKTPREKRVRRIALVTAIAVFAGAGGIGLWIILDAISRG